MILQLPLAGAMFHVSVKFQRNVSSDDGDTNANVTRKFNVMLPQLPAPSCKFQRPVQDKKKNEQFTDMCSRSAQ